jgi:HSP20 family molecular chaperone IbpA
MMATTKTALTGSSTTTSKVPRFADEDGKSKISQALQDHISLRAYSLYEESGQPEGNHFSDWLQAESEILQRSLDVRESGSWLALNASLPDVAPEDVLISVEPTRVLIHATRGEEIKNDTAREIGSTRRDLFLVQDLNVEVDPETASASLKDQKLTLMVKKKYPIAAATDTPLIKARE